MSVARVASPQRHQEGRRDADPLATRRRWFVTSLARWFKRHGRHTLPWRLTHDPYAVLVSEFMLQQTQVARVVPTFQKWMGRFPTLRSLADAPVRDVLTHWSGLGYNRRGLNLQRSARVILDDFHGAFPRTIEDLRTLPGVGPYTAAAVRAFAFNLPGTAADVNVVRVLGRVFVGPRPIAATRAAALAQLVVPASAARTTYGALMDLGALICTASSPRCTTCPLQSRCPSAGLVRVARTRTKERVENGKTHPRRIYRGRVLRAIVANGPLTLAALGPYVIPTYARADRAWMTGLVHDLIEEGFLVQRGTRIALSES